MTENTADVEPTDRDTEPTDLKTALIELRHARSEVERLRPFVDMVDQAQRADEPAPVSAAAVAPTTDQTEAAERRDRYTAALDGVRGTCASAASAAMAVADAEQAELRTRIRELDSMCRDTDRLRKDWLEMRDRTERVEAKVQQLQTDRADVLREAADFFQGLHLTGTTITAQEAEAELRRRAAELRRVAGEAQQPETQAAEVMFASDGCTCKPWTTDPGGRRRFMEPGESVDRVSGWHVMPTCPRHQPAAVSPPAEDAPVRDARPRCPHCQMPHDLTPGSMPVAACKSILASLAKADQLHSEGDHSRCAAVACDVVRAAHAARQGEEV